MHPPQTQGDAGAQLTIYPHYPIAFEVSWCADHHQILVHFARLDLMPFPRNKNH
jgi:hypothetical protein